VTRRYLSRTDSVQEEIVRTLRQMGVQVEHTHQVGGGFVDLVCLVRGKVILVEVKTPHGTLTPAEVMFQAHWPVHIIRSVEDAVEFVNGLAEEA